MRDRRKNCFWVKIRQGGMLLLAGVLLWQQPLTVFATSAGQAAKEKKEAEKKLNDANRRANEAQQKRNNAQSEVATLSSELSELLAEISLLEVDIAYKNDQIHEAQGEYDAAKTREETQYEAMKKRIKYMYERGETEYLDILLQVKSMTDLLNKSEYIEALYTYDREKLEEYQETKLQVKQYKAQLENEKAEMEGMQLEYEAQQAELETTIAQKRQEIADFDVQLAKAKSEAAAYTAAIAKKNEQIRQAQAEEARRRAEAQRQAEAASRQAAEAASLAAAASTAAAENPAEEEGLIAQNPISDPGGSNTQNVQAPTAAQTTAAASTTAAEGPKAETTKSSGSPAKSSGGGSGQAVVNYAMQFIGNPYVYGGTSLTNGADCSGFVQSVYKNFGVSLPRSSSQQRSAGTAVDYADAQPGDIICYAGHVGIYIGNGQIVHASSPTTGIKVGNATYRSILSVRRILN